MKVHIRLGSVVFAALVVCGWCSAGFLRCTYACCPTPPVVVCRAMTSPHCGKQFEMAGSVIACVSLWTDVLLLCSLEHTDQSLHR